MILGNNYFGRPSRKVYDNEIKSRQVLSNLEKQTVDTTLLTIFQAFFDAIAEKRPTNYRDFPAK